MPQINKYCFPKEIVILNRKKHFFVGYCLVTFPRTIYRAYKNRATGFKVMGRGTTMYLPYLPFKLDEWKEMLEGKVVPDFEDRYTIQRED